VHALVIDDAKPMRTLLGHLLRDIGFEVSQACDGQEGLQQLQEIERPDLVLCDWNMPGMDGYEFVLAMRSNHDYDDVRLMMVTTEAEMDKVVKALEAGADEYAMKPFTKEVIVEKLALMGLATTTE